RTAGVDRLELAELLRDLGEFGGPPAHHVQSPSDARGSPRRLIAAEGSGLARDLFVVGDDDLVVGLAGARVAHGQRASGHLVLPLPRARKVHGSKPMSPFSRRRRRPRIAWTTAREIANGADDSA